MRAPDLIEKVIGYRAWRIDGDRLRPMNIGGPWVPGVNTAQCAVSDRARPDGDHVPPVSDCGCGLYLRHDLGQVVSRSGPMIVGAIVGAVAAWGALEVHAGGVRAQYAEVIALAMPAQSPARPPSAARSEALARAGWRIVGGAGQPTFQNGWAEGSTQHLGCVADAYGVPLVDRADLEAIALEVGSPVPEEMRPKRTPPSRPYAPGQFYFNSKPLADAVERMRLAAIESTKHLNAALKGLNPPPGTSHHG